MKVPSYFKDFLASIRPTQAMIDDLKKGHTTLRRRLAEDEKLKKIVFTTFLQGSYKRSTALRPFEDKKADVDTIAVTDLDERDYTPAKAFALFEPFLEKHYPGKWKKQGRSFGIELSYVKLDLVITSAPSEAQRAIYNAAGLDEETLEERASQPWLVLNEVAKAAAWKQSPLRIPDREAQVWESTHPLEQIRWTYAKNELCNSHYVNVVKAIKWWKNVKVEKPKHPKGYPVEHLVGVTCPNGIDSVAEGVTRTLELIAANYAGYAAIKQTPSMADHGVPTHDVFKRISGEDFALFHQKVTEASKVARRALDAEDLDESARLWRELFGDKFPGPSGGYTARQAPTIISGGRFA